MATTLKTILVEAKSITEVLDISKEHLRSNGFRIKELHNELICTRGIGFLTAQQRFVLNFSQQDSQTVRIDGEFFILAYWFIKSTVDEKALVAGIPKRKGYKLMQEYITRINGKVIEEVEVGKRFCPKCGAELREGDNFCNSCRTRIGEIGIEKAGAGPRFGSFILDVIIVYVIWLIVGCLPLFLADAFDEDLGVPYLYLSFLAISLGYFTYFFGNGQTLGMKAAKIKLCGTDGTYPIGYGNGFLRWIGMGISGLVIYLGFLWILIDDNKQGWHDKIAGTYVLNEGTTMEVPEEREKEKEEEPIKGPEEEKENTIGIKVCSVLFVVGGLMQFVAMVTGSMLLGFVIFGSLLVGLAMFAAAYGIWNSKNWGRMLGIILGTLELVLGGVMGGILMSFPDILLGVSGFIILYFLLIDKNTKTLFMR